MNNANQQPGWLRNEMLHLLSLSGTLAGLSITGITLLQKTGKDSVTVTIADDALAFSAFTFLICTYIIFFALRAKTRSIAFAMEKLVDFLFSVALTAMVASGFIMIYTAW